MQNLELFFLFKSITDFYGVISVEDVDLADPSAGQEEALSSLQPGYAESLDILDGRGEAVK